MKNIAVVGAVVLPLLALTVVQESPEKSIARGDFFYQWCINNALKEYRDLKQREICGVAAQRIRDKEATLSRDLERKFQGLWEKAQREIK